MAGFIFSSYQGAFGIFCPARSVVSLSKRLKLQSLIQHFPFPKNSPLSHISPLCSIASSPFSPKWRHLFLSEIERFASVWHLWLGENLVLHPVLSRTALQRRLRPSTFVETPRRDTRTRDAGMTWCRERIHESVKDWCILRSNLSSTLEERFYFFSISWRIFWGCHSTSQRFRILVLYQWRNRGPKDPQGPIWYEWLYGTKFI